MYILQTINTAYFSFYFNFQVIFAQQLFNKVRVKRDVLFDGIRGVSQELYELWNQVTNVPQKQSSDSFGDPFWRTQWYMVRNFDCSVLLRNRIRIP